MQGRGWEEVFIHGLRKLAERCREQLGMAVTEQELGDLKRLERDYQPTRSPDALVEGTPRGAYDRADYQRAAATFEAARVRVEAVWQTLVEASEARGDDSDPVGGPW